MDLSKEDIEKYGTEEEKKLLEKRYPKDSIMNTSFSKKIEKELLSPDVQNTRNRISDNNDQEYCFDYGFRMGFEKGFQKAKE